MFSKKKNKRSVEITKKKNKKRDSYRISYFFSGFLYMLLFSFLNFILYITAGDYSIFNKFGHLNTEILLVFVVIAAVSFVIMLLLSFSKVFVKLFLSFFTAFIIYKSLDMLLVVDVSYFISSLQDSLISSLGVDATNYIMNNGNLILSAVFGLIFFIFLLTHRAKFISLMALVLLGVVSVVTLVSNVKINHIEKTGKNILVKDGTDKGKNFVYIVLNQSGNLTELNDYLSSEYVKDTKESKRYLDIVAGFYANYNFELFTNSFTTQKDKKKSVIANMNFNNEFDKDLKDYADEVYNTDILSYNKQKPIATYMNKNELYKYLLDNNYNINVYNTRNVNMCSGVDNIKKCKRYLTKPSAVDKLYISDLSKSIWSGMKWLNSLGLINYRLTYKMLTKYMVDVSLYPLISKNFDEIYSANQFDIINDMIVDIKSSDKKQNNAYIAYLMLPSDALVFDEYCRAYDDLTEWQSLNYNDWQNISPKLINDTHIAYGKQLACSYGMLGKLIDNIKEVINDESNIIIIQGDGNIYDKKDIIFKKTGNDDLLKLKSDYFAGYAVFDGSKNKFIANNEFCDISTLLSNKFGEKKSCAGFDYFKFHESFKYKLDKLMSDRSKFNYDYDKSKKVYSNWKLEWNKNYNEYLDEYKLEHEEKNNFKSIFERINSGKGKLGLIREIPSEKVEPIVNDVEKTKAVKKPEELIIKKVDEVSEVVEKAEIKDVKIEDISSKIDDILVPDDIDIELEKTTNEIENDLKDIDNKKP